MNRNDTLLILLSEVQATALVRGLGSKAFAPARPRHLRLGMVALTLLIAAAAAAQLFPEYVTFP